VCVLRFAQDDRGGAEAEQDDRGVLRFAQDDKGACGSFVAIRMTGGRDQLGDDNIADAV
jgi:hypothetical protein